MRLIASLAVMMSLSGCVNILHTRNPLSDGRLSATYQSTETSLDIAIVVAFPQVLALDGRRGLSWWNAITVPLGCMVLLDTVCEALVDTVLFPLDATIVTKRRRELYGDDEECDDIDGQPPTPTGGARSRRGEQVECPVERQSGR